MYTIHYKVNLIILKIFIITFWHTTKKPFINVEIYTFKNILSIIFGHNITIEIKQKTHEKELEKCKYT